MIKLISGNSNNELAKEIAFLLNIEYIHANSKKFPDGEITTNLDIIGSSSEIFIFQSLSNPVNDNLIELLLLADAVRRSGVKKITAIIPYLGYTRQDRIYNNSAVSGEFIPSLIKTAGISRVITFDIHSIQNKEFFQIPIYNLSVNKIFLPILKQFSNYIIVSPDNGSRLRSIDIANSLLCEVAFVNKIRMNDGSIQILDIIGGNITKTNCILIDDIVDTGNTLSAVSNFLLRRNALSVNAFITHGVLSGDACNLLDNSSIEQIYLTNTILNKNLPDKFKQVTVSILLADFIKTQMLNHSLKT